MVSEETKIDADKCVRCGKDKNHGALRRDLPFCVPCARELSDEQYLDDGSESVIKENADRPKQVRVDLNEQETELDKLLEEY
jgi:hypothetical protein